MSKNIRILGQIIDNIDIAGVIDRVAQCVSTRQFAYCVTPNVDHLMKLRRDREFRGIYDGAILRVPDGMPLVWAARLQGRPLLGRVNGTDLFECLSAHSAKQGWSIFLLGGAGESAAQAAAELVRRNPELRIAGFYAPPMGFEKDLEECRRIEEMIQASEAEILFVGVGAPKQERWIFRHGAACGVSFAIGVGVSFSFVAGTIPRAPRWMQVNGLEWLWRLAQEPHRLWKRYLIDDLPFLWLVTVEALRARGSRSTAFGIRSQTFKSDHLQEAEKRRL